MHVSTARHWSAVCRPSRAECLPIFSHRRVDHVAVVNRSTRPLLGLSHQRRAELGMLERIANRMCQLNGVSRFDDPRVVRPPDVPCTDQVRDTAGDCGDNRTPGQHRVDEGRPQAFFYATETRTGHMPVAGRVLVAEARHLHGRLQLRSRMRRGAAFPDRRRRRSRGVPVEIAAHLPAGLNQMAVSLAGHETADAQQDLFIRCNAQGATSPLRSPPATRAGSTPS